MKYYTIDIQTKELIGEQYSDKPLKNATEKTPLKTLPCQTNFFNEEKNEWELKEKIQPDYDEFSEYTEFNGEWIVKPKDVMYKSGFSNSNRGRMFFYKMSRLFQNLEDSYEGKIYDNSIKEVSILIPCYNKAPFVIETLQSVFKQTTLPKKVHILLMDEASINMKQQIENISDIIEVEVCGKKNIIDSRMYLINKCTTKDFIFLDADDVLPNNFIEECSKSKSYFVFPTYRLYVDGKEGMTGVQTKSFIHNALTGNMTGIMNKEKFLEIGGLDPEFYDGCEDFDLRLRAICSPYAVDFHSNTYYLMRRDTDPIYINSSVFYAERGRIIEFSLIRKHCKLLSDNLKRTNNTGNEVLIRTLIKYFNTFVNKELDDYYYEILYYFFNAMDDVIDPIKFDDTFLIEEAHKNVSWITYDLPELLINMPIKMFNSYKKKETTNIIDKNITAFVYGSEYPEYIDECIDNLKANGIKDIIVYNGELSIKEASREMAECADGDWLLIIDSYLGIFDYGLKEAIGENCDVYFFKGISKGYLSFREYMSGNNCCLINKKFFMKSSGYSNNYDFGLECFSNGVCLFSKMEDYYYLGEIQLDDNTFEFSLDCYKALRNNKHLFDTLIKCYKKDSNNKRKLAIEFMSKVFDKFDPSYEFLKRILEED